MNGRETSEIQDFDRDSLHTLPLTFHPIETSAVRRARMIKNARLESVIEFFRGSATGSGQMDIEGVAREFDWPETGTHPDHILLRKLGELPSYDIYSLRILLRRDGIPVNDFDELRLSEAKRQELTVYMKDFTRPLIIQIFGGEDVAIRDFEDVIALFRDPDVTKAREKLKVMARKLGIGLEQVPKFLEDYGDIFLSLAYYRRCLEVIDPVIDQFVETLSELSETPRFRGNTVVGRTCVSLQSTITRLIASLIGRFDMFNRSTKDMWDNISAQRFHEVETMIRCHHTSIGGILCALTVKMDAWAEAFPDRQVGGPGRRSEFVMSEMRQGIDKVRQMEAEARQVDISG